MQKVADGKFTNIVSCKLENVIILWQEVQWNCCCHNLEGRSCAPETSFEEIGWQNSEWFCVLDATYAVSKWLQEGNGCKPGHVEVGIRRAL